VIIGKQNLSKSHILFVSSLILFSSIELFVATSADFEEYLSKIDFR